MMNYRFIEQ